jgi:hypothetical protein
LKIIQIPQSWPPIPQGNSQSKAIDREQEKLQPLNFQDYFFQIPLKGMEKIVGVAQLYFMPHPLLEIVQRLMAHPVWHSIQRNFCAQSVTFTPLLDKVV